jgi:hypothetical protein
MLNINTLDSLCGCASTPISKLQMIKFVICNWGLDEMIILSWSLDKVKYFVELEVHAM